MPESDWGRLEQRMSTLEHWRYTKVEPLIRDFADFKQDIRTEIAPAVRKLIEESEIEKQVTSALRKESRHKWTVREKVFGFTVAVIAAVGTITQIIVALGVGS